ncbi:MAG: FxLD family lanthipeptide [Pseudonocardiaceae bacterium]
MSDNLSGAVALAPRAGLAEEFALDVRVIEAAQPVANLLLSTSDNCGSTCSGTACPSQLSYPV